jgi:hypothetical protein
VPGGALVALKDQADDRKDALQWKWGKGAATMLADLGDPTATTRYDLCIYDGTAALTASAAAPAGGPCGSRPCWTATNAGFRYLQKALAPNGLQRVDVRSGADGKARILVKGRGVLLSLPSLPVATLPLTVQVANGNGRCWSATYAANIRTNQPGAFKAHSD